MNPKALGRGVRDCPDCDFHRCVEMLSAFNDWPDARGCVFDPEFAVDLMVQMWRF